MNMSEETYREHYESDDGYCANCDKVTRFGDTEPDAVDYPCEECGENSVIGMELALIEGLINIED